MAGTFDETKHPRDNKGRFAIVQKDAEGRLRSGHSHFKEGIHSYDREHIAAASSYLSKVAGIPKPEAVEAVSAARAYTDYHYKGVNGFLRGQWRPGIGFSADAPDVDQYKMQKEDMDEWDKKMETSRLR